MANALPTLLVEGWRFIPHSYSCVNMWQLLELGMRPDLNLLHKDMPLWVADWKPQKGLFDPLRERRVDKIAACSGSEKADVVYRIYAPFSFVPDRFARKTLLFMTTEHGWVREESCAAGTLISKAMRDERLHVLTPSNWSKFGLVRSGFPEDRITILPHGVDVRVFRPLAEGERASLRERFGWQGSFVFLHVGAMSDNKWINGLLYAFSCIVKKHPEALLFLKGVDGIHSSEKRLFDIVKSFGGSLSSEVLKRIHYDGSTISFCELAQYYQAADTYISPYIAEGFNLPVLEAMACGLPVVCTKGGPTDDYLLDEGSLTISSKIKQFSGTNLLYLQPDMDCLIMQMGRVIEDACFTVQARNLAPSHVARHYSWRNISEQILSVAFD